MGRQPPTLIDIAERTEHTRSGMVIPLERLELGEGTLYCARKLIAHPRIAAVERWLLPAQGWVVNRFHLHPETTRDHDWYVDLDQVEPRGDVWKIQDGFLDVVVRECHSYRVLDADELADGIEQGELTSAETVATLRSFHALIEALHRLDCSGSALLDEYAPGLPR